MWLNFGDCFPPGQILFPGLTFGCLFSPEKDHAMQLRVFHRLLNEHPEYTRDDDQRIKLVLVGGSRNEGDARRVDELRKLAKELSIEVCPYNC